MYEQKISSLLEDPWVSQQAATHDVSELEDCAIAVDATYYLQLFLDKPPFHEPLLAALGGLTGLRDHIEHDLDQWEAHRITPFFVFDGQPIVGQDEVCVLRGAKAIANTDQAWELYFNGKADAAVAAFGENNGGFRVQALYPLLQGILKARKLHFLVPPFNASAQIAYFDMTDSDQCAGIMGSQDLLLYPIKDGIIKDIKWEDKKLKAISKRHLVKTLGVNDSTLVDILLMAGTSFLPPFPPMLDRNVVPREPTVMDAINMLRTADKSVTNACVSFADIIQARDPNWLDKYRKARMAIGHFIYIAESGEIKVHDYDRLTKDNHEYLGLQLPSELFHYLNTGLISPRMLGWVSHCKIIVPPTLDGYASTEYKRLVTHQLAPIKEMTLGLLIPRLNRGIQHRDVKMKVWYDDDFESKMNLRNDSPSPSTRAATWNFAEAALESTFPQPASGSIAFEVSALQNPEIVQNTLGKEKIKGGLEQPDAIISLAVWKLLHLRDYVNDSHQLTAWGLALSKTFGALEPVAAKNKDVPGLYEAGLLAFELIRFDLLGAKNRHEGLYGLPLNGTDEDKTSLLLISRCATLLKLRHQSNGYTGPLSKNLLNFHSLTGAVRDADRDLIEAIVAAMFMHGQAKRDRDDTWQIGRRLPFLDGPDVSMSIAVKTYLDDVPAVDTAKDREERRQQFPGKYVPFATHIYEDLEISFAFFEALHTGIKSLGTEMSANDKASWEKASKYLELRR